jgi:hypothetical protein
MNNKPLIETVLPKSYLSLSGSVLALKPMQIRNNDSSYIFFLWSLLERWRIYVSRGPFGDFVTIRTEGSMQDITVARLQSTGVQTPLSPLF